MIADDHFPEKRRGYLWGITPGEWLGATGMVLMTALSLTYGYAVLGQTVRQNAKENIENKAKIEQVHQAVSTEIQESESRLRQEIKDSEQRTRDDIHELRQLILKRRE